MLIRRATALLLVLFGISPAAWSQDGGQDFPIIYPKDALANVPSTRIIGGTEAKANNWPYQVFVAFVKSVSQDGQRFSYGACGGTVIAPRWILTAAHCVVADGRIATGPEIVIQTGSKTKLEGGAIQPAKRVIVHEGYPLTGDKTVNDIALIELADDAGVRNVPLAEGAIVSDVEREGKTATIVGWGRISPNTKESSDWLLEANVPITGYQNCRKPFSARLRKAIGPNQICAGDARPGKSSCNGDSGGPLLSRGKDGRYYQIGIVSWGIPDCKVSLSVYSRVSAFVPWIRQYVRLPAPPAPPAPVVQQGDRALVIGIDDYEGDSNDLQGSVTDAKNVQRLLIDHLGFRADQIRLLTDGQATRANILKAIDEWLIAGSRDGARVFFYFAGHGFYQADQNGDEADGTDELLLPQDMSGGGGASIANAIIDDELRQKFSRIQNRKVTVLIDSCHSGTMTRSVNRPEDGAFKRMPTLGGFGRQMRSFGVSTRSAQRATAFEVSEDHVTTWTAVSPSQLALVDLEAPEYQGVFTRRFVAGIAEKKADFNQDGKVNHAELLDYVTQESEAYCRRNPAQCSLGLTPSLEGPAKLMTTDVISGQHAPGAGAGASAGINGNNEARISIAVEPNGIRPLDSELRFRVESNLDGHFTLFEIGPDDTLTVLLPNPDAHIDNYTIGKGQAQIVPDSAELGYEWFGVGPPVGRYSLVAVVSEAQLDYEQLRRSLTGQGAAAFVDALSKQLRARWADGESAVRSPRWSVASATYEIVP